MKKYEKVTEKERKILQKLVDMWFKNGPSSRHWIACPALIKQAVMEYIANSKNKTIF